MPSLVHKSASFTAKGYAITDQSINIEPTGLVRVALKYTFANDKLPALFRLFRAEAPPLETPSVISNVFGGKLYLVNHAASRSNGLLEVTAEYVGARPGLDANGRDIFTTTDYETQTVSFDLEIGRRLTNPVQAINPVPPNPIYEKVFERRIVRFTSAIKTEQSASDLPDAASNAALNSLNLTAGQTLPESLLLGAYWVNAGRQTNWDAGTLSSVLVTNAYDPLGEVFDPNFVTFIDIPSQNLPIYRESNALEFLRKVIRLNSNYVRAVVTTNLTVENASQNVRVIGRQLSLRFLGKIYRGDTILIGT